jgi:hypothetical protein
MFKKGKFYNKMSQKEEIITKEMMSGIKPTRQDLEYSINRTRDFIKACQHKIKMYKTGVSIKPTNPARIKKREDYSKKRREQELELRRLQNDLDAFLEEYKKFEAKDFS